MKYICDAPERRTWFRIETPGEAAIESETMRHAVEKFFLREYERASQSYQPPVAAFIERDIGLAAHIQRVMPVFLTLRNHEGLALATAMLPPLGKEDANFRTIIVGQANADPYAKHAESIAALAKHYGLALDRQLCFPYHIG